MSKLIFSFLFVLGFLPLSIYGCSCAYSDPAGAFNESEMVFVGRVIGGTENVTAYFSAKLPPGLVAGQVKFAVENIYKGRESTEVTIGVSSNIKTSCGPYGLKSGEKYVVYAYGTEKDKSKLYTGVCTRTREVTSEYAAGDLKFLRELPAAGTGGNIRGRLQYDTRETSGGAARPLADVKITIRNAFSNQVFTVISDKKGEFSVQKIPAGKYIVTPQQPVNFYFNNKSQEIDVADRGTADAYFEAYYRGRITGKIVDKNNIGFEGTFLTLKSIDGDPQRKTVNGVGRGRRGDYTVSGVPPGKYRLYIELTHKDHIQKDVPYYYPGTFDPQKAKIIEVKLGEQISGINFPFPVDYEIRTISGQVFHANGTPAAKVEVLLLCPTGLAKNDLRFEFSPTKVNTDADGRFEIQGFAGETYWLEARGEFSRKSEGFEQKSSLSQKIQLQNNLRNVKLILTEDKSQSCANKKNEQNLP